MFYSISVRTDGELSLRYTWTVDVINAIPAWHGPIRTEASCSSGGVHLALHHYSITTGSPYRIPINTDRSRITYAGCNAFGCNGDYQAYTVKGSSARWLVAILDKINLLKINFAHVLICQLVSY
jgi:hypothetical protein